tara:strand:+ start:32 stop:1048 length:1017 start_codon:yes stop_codon:yes gene_type:complete
MYDIVNKAQNLTLPVVAINLTSVSRDESRVFNKLAPSFIPSQLSDTSNKASKFLMPVPVNLEVNMSILARYMADADQIISNFVPYNNPYLILSWKVPADFGADYEQEIRSEVLWSGTLNYNSPTDITYSDKFRVAIDTSFTIKGWLFPEQKDTQATIYKVDNNFVNVNLANRIYDPEGKELQFLTYEQQGYNALSSYNERTPNSYTETVTISAIPEFTNIFLSTSGTFAAIRNNTTILSSVDNNFTLYGKRFDTNNNYYLSSNVDNFFTNYQQITSVKSSTISAYKLDESFFSTGNDNIVNIFIPRDTLSVSGSFTFITANEAGWSTSYQAQSSIITI